VCVVDLFILLVGVLSPKCKVYIKKVISWRAKESERERSAVSLINEKRKKCSPYESYIKREV
jgi:hypothetical protein